MKVWQEVAELAGDVEAAVENMLAPLSDRQEIRVGQKWRSNLGGKPVVVVGFDGGLVLVKGADESKKNLARAAGGRIVSRTELHEEWTLLEDTATTRDP